MDSSLDPIFLFLQCLVLVQPMIDYLNEKETQGGFFSRPQERVHLPEPAELALKYG